MKKKFLSLFALVGVSSLVIAQVGINTPSPTSTLDITAKNATGTTTNVDGLLIPRVDRQRAQSMKGVQTSTLIYVNGVANGTQAGTAVNIDTVGYYYYNGTVWVKLNATSASVNIYNSDGTLTGNRIVTQGANTLAFNGTATNGFSVDGTTLSVDAANDRVGIGTITPSVKLDVAQAIGTSEATQLRIINTSPVAANNTAYMGFNSYNGGGASWGMGTIQNSASATDNTFQILHSNGGNYLKYFNILPSGFTGILTGMPQRTLHVNGSLQITNELNVGGNGSTPGSAGAAGEVLVSNGPGAAPKWVLNTASKKPAIGVLGAGTDITGITPKYTGTTITLPPGKWMVTSTMLLKMDNRNSEDDFGWLRSSLSNSPTTLAPSSDIVSMASLFSGGSTRYTPYALTGGNVLIENTSGAPKTYYYYYAWGEFTGGSTNKLFVSFGGTYWGEDMLYAIPVN
ncbi:hypothetical protein [Chryseobacterium sp. G0201]|uniref:hypothetical protein n=1 Tax=Chryseobacterium sp. G0201 TaxID=2487065 RepID=UPI000F502606|nr:hypothetical protein [Chryseobacterium sp. G0201]AZA51577.1 hypothetical protein EG348_00425 [Chryseobacterium sp. G0201]